MSLDLPLQRVPELAGLGIVGQDGAGQQDRGVVEALLGAVAARHERLLRDGQEACFELAPSRRGGLLVSEERDDALEASAQGVWAVLLAVL